MREFFVTLDSNGKALDVGTRGIGFRLVPARPQSAAVGTRPGSYPIRVKPDGGSTELHITADDTRRLESFKFLVIEGGEAGDVWKVQIIERPGEHIDPPGQRGSVNVQVQPATPCTAGVPTLATQGFKVRPGTKAHTFYASGVPEVANLFVRSAGGTWYPTGEELDFTANNVITRVVYNSTDRVYLQASGAMLIEIDSEVEVG